METLLCCATRLTRCVHVCVSVCGYGICCRPARLFKPPYAYQAVPVRPIMLDTASAALDYPSLEGRVRRADKKAGAAAAGSSMLSSLFSWRR